MGFQSSGVEGGLFDEITEVGELVWEGEAPLIESHSKCV